MSGIRPLAPADVPAAAALFEATVGTGSSPQGLQRLFHAVAFEDPWTDPELPSLAYEDEEGALVGFFSRSVRRMRFDGEPVRFACGMHFAVAPEVRGRAVAPLLFARLLGGAQDASFTDGANEPTRRLFEGLRGQLLALESLEWTRVLRPATYWHDRVAGRLGRPRLTAPSHRLAGALDRPFRRTPRAGAAGEQPAGTIADEPLTPEAMVEHLDALTGWARLRPDYDLPFLRWLFAQLARTPSYGDLAARLVRRDGEPIGWHLSLVKPGGEAMTLQVVARPGEAPAVFDAMLDHVRELGAVAARGRVEAPLLEAITSERSVLRRGNSVLLRVRDPQLLAAVQGGSGLFTRLDGNAWIDTRGR